MTIVPESHRRLLNPALFRHHETFIFQAKGPFAMWGRKGNPINQVSLMCPTPTNAMGCAKTIYHANSIFPVLERVEILNPVDTVNFAETQYKAGIIPSETGKYSRHMGKALKSPNASVHLRNTEYRFTFKVWAMDDRKIKTLRKRHAQGASYCGLYFGQRGCGAVIVPIDNKPPEPTVNFIEPCMLIGSRPAIIQAKNGVVVFPSWTKEAMLEWREQQLDLAGSLLDEKKEDDNDSD